MHEIIMIVLQEKKGRRSKGDLHYTDQLSYMTRPKKLTPEFIDMIYLQLLGFVIEIHLRLFEIFNFTVKT